MALVLNDEQTMLRDNARGFLAKNAPVAHLRALRDNRDADGFSRELWKNFVEMGWAGILVPVALPLAPFRSGQGRARGSISRDRARQRGAPR